PSLVEGPSADSSTTPIEVSSLASKSASNSSPTVFGRKAFRTLGRLKAILATPSDFLYVMSSYSFTTFQFIIQKLRLDPQDTVQRWIKLLDVLFFAYQHLPSQTVDN